jgi:hypothetical protein
MASSYFYSNNAVQTALSGSISAGSATISVGAVTGFPGSYPYVLALDYGAATEELVTVTAAAGLNLTVTRGFGGTSAQSHSLGATVRHVYNAIDATDFRTHEAATVSVHGVTGALVGATQSQTLTNKTLTTPTINGAALTGTFSGTPNFSGTNTVSGSLASSGGSLTGSWAGSPSFTGTPSFAATAYSAVQQSTQSAAGNVVEAAIVSGDSFDRWRVYGDGKQEWGSGTLTRDTNLYRSATDTLATDDSLSVGGALAVTGDISASTTTWSPFTPSWTVSGSPSMSTNVGWYKKIGKLVFFEIYTVWSASGSTSAQITVNAPSNIFRDGNGAGTTRQMPVYGWISGSATLGPCIIMGQATATDATLPRMFISDFGNSGVQSAFIQNGTIITFQGWYREA